ncbi:unnamed protein product [Agarophyton chilense]|eukprot:gb/GEZJ01001691.1/.p2 GENE.gb/GEZJ01001691.1/~~gb/GEZJ01001691.1/.p2  ORF type:complete len:358 (+),score=44.64 gb/GEZJ01001691.1/:3312-4385(+)
MLQPKRSSPPPSTRLGSPVTPAPAPSPPDDALHLLCLAATHNRSAHHHVAQPLPPHNAPSVPAPLMAPYAHQFADASAVPPQPFALYPHYAPGMTAPLLPMPFAAQQMVPPEFGGALHAHAMPYAPSFMHHRQSVMHMPLTPLPIATQMAVGAPLVSQPPRRVKGPWRPEEDKILTELVNKLGARRWTLIASHIAGRTGKQARERWLNQLAPHLTKRPWTPEEDRIVMDAHAKLGNRWSEIAKLLKGRTDNATKNRFNTTIRRQISQLSNHARCTPVSEVTAAASESADVATAAAAAAVATGACGRLRGSLSQLASPVSQHVVIRNSRCKRKRDAGESSASTLQPLTQRAKSMAASS